MIPELKAFIMWQLKDLDSAEKYYLTALSSAKQIMPYGHPSQIKILKTLTRFYFDENRFGEALPINYELLDIYLNQYPEKNAIVIEQKLVIALVMNNLQDHEKAVEILNNVLQYTDVEISDYAKRIFNNLYSTYKSE
jgi:tetratricopeptide (TPR) repeat protein